MTAFHTTPLGVFRDTDYEAAIVYKQTNQILQLRRQFCKRRRKEVHFFVCRNVLTAMIRYSS